MNNKKQTKKALCMSVLSMVLCVAMLVGMTFAWFTDTASTGVNTIQAGELKVKLEYKDGDAWKDAEGQMLTFKTADNRTADKILWEPGCTYELPELRVVNDGNLALKYKIAITGIKGDAELNEVIDWTISDNTLDADHSLAAKAISDALTIKGHMQESAGNKYQGMSIDGIAITVYATQDTVEYDSNSNQYDKDAKYPQVYTPSTADDYNAALTSITTANGQETVDIKLAGQETTITGANAINPKAGNIVSVDFSNKTVEVGSSAGSTSTETNGAQFLKGSTVTLKNGTYKFAANNQYKKILIQNYSNLTLNNVTLDAHDVAYALSTNCGKVTIKGNTNIIVQSGGTALDVMHWENASYKEEGSHVVIDESMTGTVDGKIEVYCYGSSVRPVDDGGATLVIKGGTFKNSGLTLEQFKTFVADGYTVTTNTDGSFTVSK